MKLNYSSVIVTDAFLALPEIKQIMSKHKSVGFTIVVLIQLELGKHKHAIGRISNLRRASHDIGIQLKTLLNIMEESSAFVMDYDHDIYYMPRLRKKFHLPVYLTEEEIKDICCNGNIYIGYGEKKSTTLSSCPNKNKKDGKKIRERFEIFETQDTDIEDVDNFSYKDKSISVKNRNKDINIENASRCSDDDAAVFEIKKILSSPSWCSSIKRRHGVDLGNDVTLGVFAQWLYYYCCANDKTRFSDSGLRQYANNLLRKGTRTRSEFDSYCEKEISEIREKQVEMPVNYEHIDKGVRISCLGQVIPDNAPKQPSPYTAFSYIQNKWIPENNYDVIPETKAFDKHMAKNHRYVSNMRNLNY